MRRRFLLSVSDVLYATTPKLLSAKRNGEKLSLRHHVKCSYTSDSLIDITTGRHPLKSRRNEFYAGRKSDVKSSGQWREKWRSRLLKIPAILHWKEWRLKSLHVTLVYKVTRFSKAERYIVLLLPGFFFRKKVLVNMLNKYINIFINIRAELLFRYFLHIDLF